jgi:hypothetical protein
MLEHYAHLAHFLEACGAVEGRKKLQKMVYLAKRLGFPLTEPFSYHHYGPYSERLSTEIGEMVFYGLVTEEVVGTSRGYKTYRYALTEKGRQLTRQNPFPPSHGLLAAINKHDSRFLKLSATLDYLMEDGLSAEEAAAKVLELKAEQHYSSDELNRAFQYLRGLKSEIL